MKMISFIFVFALFIIVTPNIFISYDKQFGVLLHCTLFVIIFYFTYDRVIKEGFSEQEINVKGMSHLVDLFGDQREESESNTVVINNDIRKSKRDELQGKTDTDKLLQFSLKKINEMNTNNEYLQNTLDAYKGHDGVIDKLQEKEKESQEQIKQLQTQIQSLHGNDDSVGKLNGIIQNLQSKNSKLNLELLKKDSM